MSKPTKKLLNIIAKSEFEGLLTDEQIQLSKKKVYTNLSEKYNLHHNYMPQNNFKFKLNLQTYMITGLVLVLALGAVSYKPLSSYIFKDKSSDTNINQTASLKDRANQKFAKVVGTDFKSFQSAILPQVQALETNSQYKTQTYQIDASKLQGEAKIAFDKIMEKQNNTAYKYEIGEGTNSYQSYYTYQGNILANNEQMGKNEGVYWGNDFDFSRYGNQYYKINKDSKAKNNLYSISFSSLESSFLNALNHALTDNKVELGKILYPELSSEEASKITTKIEENKNNIILRVNQSLFGNLEITFDKDLNLVSYKSSLDNLTLKVKIQEISAKEFKNLVNKFISTHKYKEFNTQSALKILSTQKIPYLSLITKTELPKSFAYLNYQDSNYQAFLKSQIADTGNDVNADYMKSTLTSEYYTLSGKTTSMFVQKLDNQNRDTVVLTTHSKEFDIKTLTDTYKSADNICLKDSSIIVEGKKVSAKLWGECNAKETKLNNGGGMPQKVYFEYNNLKYTLTMPDNFDLIYEDIKDSYEIKFTTAESNQTLNNTPNQYNNYQRNFQIS
jgi:hypothetical protein